MSPLNYLTKYRSEWLDKPEALQRQILDELCNDWAKDNQGKDHGAFFDAVTNKNNLKYWHSLPK